MMTASGLPSDGVCGELSESLDGRYGTGDQTAVWTDLSIASPNVRPVIAHDCSPIERRVMRGTTPARRLPSLPT